ncbi:hypothetical protein FA15DRAFT_345853 [Coprinopsis marcescibilis]|uniref:Clp1-like protein n=1 Tax=Coprinopsis marcescibilis TaxID=230819 RepID=A0A5C3L9U9_COPMA|nr:hypothetical protein FA15DRAFT_345853 [Coprinopsis marcescibilis]
MVLRSNIQLARRADTENLPPATPLKPGSRQLNTLLHDANRRRRGRTTGVPRSNPKFLAEQAKRKLTAQKGSKASNSPSSMKFVIPVPQSGDVEMRDASPTSSKKTIPITLPKELARPQFKEVAREAIAAVDPELADTDPEYIREKLEEFGPSMLAVLGTVKATTALANSALPAEIEVKVEDMSNSVVPSHMVAVFGPPPKTKPATATSSTAGPSKPRKVTLFPIHSVVLASHCANLPPFPAASTSTEPCSENTIRIPVRSLCLPSPDQYPHLAAYLYHKRTTALLNTLLPSAAPQGLELNQTSSSSSKAGPSMLSSFATRLGRTFTFEMLLLHTMMVHGVWQNACALGIYDQGLWDTIDLAWEVLLTALSVSHGKPGMMIEGFGSN